MTITFMNFAEKFGLIGQAAKGDGTAIAKLGLEANTAHITANLFKDSATGGRQVWNAFRSGNAAGMLHGAKQAGFSALMSGQTETALFRAFPSQSVQRFLPSAVKALDKSLLETGVGRGILSRFGGSAAVSGSNAVIKGGAAAQVAGRGMARIPVLGILISAAFEVPNIIDAFKNGDGMSQIGRSAMKVGCSTIGAAIGGALGSLIPIPGLGTVIGAAVGGFIGNAVGKFLGNAIFGKSIKDKMSDGDYAKDIMRSYSNLSFFNNNKNVANTSGLNFGGGGNVDVNALLNNIDQGMARMGY